jgi:hypothetical protein
MNERPELGTGVGTPNGRVRVFRTFEQAGRIPAFPDFVAVSPSISERRRSPTRPDSTSPKTRPYRTPGALRPAARARSFASLIGIEMRSHPGGKSAGAGSCDAPCSASVTLLVILLFPLVFQEQGSANYLSDNHKLFSRNRRANPAQKIDVE